MKQFCTIILLFASYFLLFCTFEDPYRPSSNIDWDGMDTLDVAYLRVGYEMSFPSSAGKDSNYVDMRIVEIGHNCRKDYSSYIEKMELEGRKLADEGKNFVDFLEGNVNPFELFVFAGQDRCRFNYKTIVLGPILQWEEKQTVFDWTLTNDADTVCGFPCHTAETDFAGRSYRAWYCPEIPVDAGPYKFDGLPGLILKIEDCSGSYVWEAVGIEKGTWPIYEKRYLFQKCSRKQARQYIKLMFDNPYMYLTSRGIRVTQADVHTRRMRELTEEEKSESFYFDPIELE